MEFYKIEALVFDGGKLISKDYINEGYDHFYDGEDYIMADFSGDFDKIFSLFQQANVSFIHLKGRKFGFFDTRQFGFNQVAIAFNEGYDKKSFTSGKIQIIIKKRKVIPTIPEILKQLPADEVTLYLNSHHYLKGV